MNQSKLEEILVGAKRGKICAGESRLVFVLVLLGRQSHANFVQCSIVMQVNSNVNYFRLSSETCSNIESVSVVFCFIRLSMFIFSYVDWNNEKRKKKNTHKKETKQY